MTQARCDLALKKLQEFYDDGKCGETEYNEVKEELRNCSKIKDLSRAAALYVKKTYNDTQYEKHKEKIKAKQKTTYHNKKKKNVEVKVEEESEKSESEKSDSIIEEPKKTSVKKLKERKTKTVRPPKNKITIVKEEYDDDSSEIIEYPDVFSGSFDSASLSDSY
jgi:hypothetical protein